MMWVLAWLPILCAVAAPLGSVEPSCSTEACIALREVASMQQRLASLSSKLAVGAAESPARNCIVTSYGAVGDGRADDTKAIQAAIDDARNTSRTVVFPAGNYRITSYLDWGRWTPISVRGEEPGNNGISGGASTVAIVADNIQGIAHDFSASAYGTVEGIAFVGGASTAMALNARTQDGGYGSDIVFRRCNFAGGAKAAFVNHMGEVITWENCKFHSGGGAPGLLVTWRAFASPWGNFTAPSGRALTTGLSLTQFRMYGGEFTGDSGAMLVLDVGDAPGVAGDFSAFGTYFATSGSSIAAVEVRGSWQNVIFDGSRDEETMLPGNPTRGFMNLNNAFLRDFRIHAYSDGDEQGPVVRGTGRLTAGTIVSAAAGGIDIVGNISAVDYRSSRQAKLKVQGDVYQTSVRSRKTPMIKVSGYMQIDDGLGGILMYQQLVDASTGKGSWNIASDGLFEAAFAGDRLVFQSSSTAGRRFTSQGMYHDQAALAGDGTLGKLVLACNETVAALFKGTADVFTVRRLSGSEVTSAVPGNRVSEAGWHSLQDDSFAV